MRYWAKISKKEQWGHSDMSQGNALCLVTKFTLLEAVAYAQTTVTLPAEIQRAPCSEHTRHSSWIASAA
jgi:hypothetical protein